MPQIVVLKRAHFFSLDNDIIDVHAKTIGAIGVAVYTALSRFANRKTGVCWPSIGRLAQLLALARNTVKAALRTLEGVGLIAIQRRRDPAGDATSHRYTLLDCSPEAVDAQLRQRHAAAVAAREGGRSAVDPPPSTTDLPGGSMVDQEPEVSPEPKDMNQAMPSGAEEKPLKTTARPPCPHPLEVRRHYGKEAVICEHCWSLLDMNLLPAAERSPEAPKEGTADANAA
jgi:hypothetical protein